MQQLKIIRASAGSGKTFNLTREYLQLLFAERDNFMHILAVTFTNKATEEMKSRIIRELYALSANLPSNQLESLTSALGLTEKQVRNKAEVILKRILHNYSKFSVSTIDAFFQRIIRSFTRELGIQGGYTIELDIESLLAEVIDRLLVKAESDKALLSWLTQFAESLIEKGENWNFKKSIQQLGRQIFREEFKCLDEKAVRLFSDRNFLNDYKTELISLCRKIEVSNKEYGLKAVKILASHGLDADDFSNKGKGPAGYLIKLANGAFRKPNATAINAATNIDKWYTKNAPRKEEIIRVAEGELMPLMQQAVAFGNDHFRQYFTALVILKNLYTLGILTDLTQLSYAWCSENNTFLLPEAPVFLNKIMDDNDTPFIYEKAGCWYHHFMIDEFQDVSLMQWLDFKPLISNSLSQGYGNLAVGDAKQSIYRWRNSSWEILEKHVDRDFLPGIMEAVTLKENWRSHENIIQFNNQFFLSAASILQGEFNQNKSNWGFDNTLEGNNALAHIYGNVEQTPGKAENHGGYVQVEFVDEDENNAFADAVNTRIVNLLCDLQDKGYQLKDIALLTRKNSEAKMLADFLLDYANNHPQDKHRFDVISDDGLRLGGSTMVSSAVALLQYIDDPSNITNNYLLASLLRNYVARPKSGEPWRDPQPDAYLPEEFLELAGSHVRYSLIEIFERIIKIFGQDQYFGEKVYLQALRDMIMEYSRTHGGSISRFLEYWQETGREKSVAAPAGQDALRILTLHKSKGLEFKITIIPYCSWDLISRSPTIIWCTSDAKPFDKIPTLPVSFSTQLLDTFFAQNYLKENYQQYIDNLNLLYVAFTRAQEGLFIFCKAREGDSLKNVSDLTKRILGPSTYTKGQLPVNSFSEIQKNSEMVESAKVSLGNASNRIRIAFQGRLFIDPMVNKPLRPINEGRILHEIFARITNIPDLEMAVQRVQLQGKITQEEKDGFLGLVKQSLDDPQVSTWFNDDWTVLNEAEIILPGGMIKRPDRVMMKTGQTVVIDYKFGKNIEAIYEQQVKEYARFMEDMGYKNVEAFVWYVRLGKVVSCR